MNRKIVVRKDRICGWWTWHCSLCYPPCHGRTQEFTKTMNNVQRHLQNRLMHHRWVARRYGRAL